MEQVVSSLREHSAAIVWGPAGEGKTTVALQAAQRLWQLGGCPGGMCTIDFEGACAEAPSEKAAILHHYFHKSHKRRLRSETSCSISDDAVPKSNELSSSARKDHLGLCPSAPVTPCMQLLAGFDASSLTAIAASLALVQHVAGCLQPELQASSQVSRPVVDSHASQILG